MDLPLTWKRRLELRSKYSDCVTLLGRLVEQPATLDLNWDNERGRLQLFAGQTFLRGFRWNELCDVSHVLNEILDLLEDLRSTLQTCKLSK